MTLRQRTIESMGWNGWHEHVYDKSVSMVWGILTDDGCDLCDRAERWLTAEEAEDISIDTFIADELRARRMRLLPVMPQRVEYIDPHTPQSLEEPEKPSLDKIVVGVSKEPEPVVVEQIELMAVMSGSRASSNDDEPELPPPPAPPPAFKLTNPDSHTLTSGGKRRRR